MQRTSPLTMSVDVRSTAAVFHCVHQVKSGEFTVNEEMED
jgi:hypothetical protein